mgnify:CR=1 FL=1
MKNRKNSLVTALLATVTLLFVGCSNGLNTPGTVKGVDAVRDVCIELTNFASSDTSARTIAPDAISKSDAIDPSNYIFIAEGENSRKTFGPEICGISNDGKIVLENLDAGVWTITITMYDKTLLGSVTDAAGIKALEETCAVLSGNAVVDLTKANTTTSMTLTPDGIGTEGKVALTLKFNQEDLNKKDSKGLEYVAGLYNKIDGTLVEGTETTAAELVSNGVFSPEDDIAKGLYTFKVTITATDETGPWYYSDDIYIEGNRTIEETIDLPKIIGEAPDAPLTLGFDFGEKNANLGRYTAKFSWERNSYNESGFELEIVELDEIPASIDNTLFDESNIFTVENFASTEYPIYAKDGTLLAGSEGINYYLETGKVYVARIRAVNYNGKSDWKYMDSIINCYTVTYDFAGYKLVKDTETHTQSIVEFVEYSNEAYATKYTDYKLYKADVVPSTAPDNSITWTGWKNRDAGEDPITSYAGFKNIVLTPITNVKNFVDFEIESAGTFETVLNGNLFAGAEEDPTSAAAEITYVDETSKLYVAVPKQIVKDGVTYTVTEVKYTLKGIDGSNVGGKTGIASTDKFTASFDLVDIYAGDYILYAEAKLTSGYIVTTQIPLKIK